MSNHPQQTNILHLHEGDGNEKYVEISNKDLVRKKIILSSMPEIDFFGTMKHFKQFDSGKINSYLILNQLGHSDDDDIEFIRVQGFILYDIITNALLPKDNLDFDDVKAALQEIKDAYEAKYNDVIVFEQAYEATFVDIIDEEETYRISSTNEDYSFISNNLPPRMECVSSNEYATIYHTTTEELQKIDFVFSKDKNGQIPIETNSIDSNDDDDEDELNECTDDNHFFTKL
ncbi:hypothetical protein M9Y10_010657 [Tritrichomonas musculus]|uniref:Uncharacterized protein n=1 Tax=Tritrichomonas musculus TaxID=1915356 RepID=A0ABR2ILE8_9EUKA